MSGKVFCCYILANKKQGTLYIGVTGDLKKRAWQHREGTSSGLTDNYGVKRLVYYEVFGEPLLAIAREKQLKGGSRAKKIELIERMNPAWEDLYRQL